MEDWGGSAICTFFVRHDGKWDRLFWLLWLPITHKCECISHPLDRRPRGSTCAQHDDAQHSDDEEEAEREHVSEGEEEEETS